MAVSQSVVGVVKPGRYEDHIALAHEAEKLFERHGAQETRLLAAGLAGEATGQWVLANEFADIEAYGRFSDEINTDPDLLSLMTRVRALDAPSQILSMSLSMDIPTGRTAAPGRGNLIEVYLTRATPGRYEEAIALGVEACDIVERAGAVNARLSTITLGGSGTQQLVASWEFANATEWARSAALWETDAKAKQVSERTLAADSPTTILFSGLYQVVPL